MVTVLRHQLTPGWGLAGTGASEFKAGDRVAWHEPPRYGKGSPTPHAGTVRLWPTTKINRRFVAVMLDSRSGPYYTSGQKLILALPRELERLA